MLSNSAVGTHAYPVQGGAAVRPLRTDDRGGDVFVVPHRQGRISPPSI